VFSYNLEPDGRLQIRQGEVHQEPDSDKGAGARDPFASIRGSSAIFAAADSAAILDTSEDGLRAKLTIRPRDARRSIIDLERDAEGLLWRNASAPAVA